jgi:hypothetical protein
MCYGTIRGTRTPLLTAAHVWRTQLHIPSYTSLSSIADSGDSSVCNYCVPARLDVLTVVRGSYMLLLSVLKSDSSAMRIRPASA